MSKLLDSAEFRADLVDVGLSIREVARKWGKSYGFVQKYRKRASVNPEFTVPAVSERVAEGSVDPVKGDSVSLGADEAWGQEDWEDWLRSKGTDPGSVTFSWGVTTNPAGGFWNKLYNVKVKPGLDGPDLIYSEEDIQKLSKGLKAYTPSLKHVPVGGTPVAAVLNLADMQLFKAEGGGVPATLARLENALDSFVAHVREVRARGWNLNELVIVNNGDPFEGLAGNYSNQQHTVQGGLRAQMNLVLEVWVMFAQTLYPMFEKRKFVTVLCNHTQFGRQGGAKSSISGDEDNGSAFLAETLRRILHASKDFDDVEFTIPEEEMNVYADVAGVPVGFNHGHKIPKPDAKGFETWLNGQVRYDRRAYDARLWITAHRHNLQMFDLGSTSVLQCPSCDGGSKWLTDTTGTHSNAGVVSILVGNHHRLGWTDLTFL